MLIEVKQDHIDKGQQGECGSCPVALALIDAGHERVSVDGVNVRTLEHLKIRLPQNVINWISMFDLVGTGDPFTFELEVSA